VFLISFLVITAPSIEERPSKRTKVNSGKNGGNAKSVQSKRLRGCLSEFPTMPLDVVFEVDRISCLQTLVVSDIRVLRFLGTSCQRTCSRLVE
jgi:hypothetical protein